MNNFFRALIAGYGAHKLGGGCLGTIIVFILIWVALGQCSFSSREVPPPATYPAKHTVCIPAFQDQCAVKFSRQIAAGSIRAYSEFLTAYSVKQKFVDALNH